MDFKQFSSTSVNVSLKELWETLMDQIQHPERYLPGVSQSKILKNKGTEIIRSIKTAVGEIVEQILIDFKNLQISFKYLKHPSLKGTLISKITPPSQKGGLVMLTYAMDYESKVNVKEGIEIWDLKTILNNTKRSAEGS